MSERFAPWKRALLGIALFFAACIVVTALWVEVAEWRLHDSTRIETANGIESLEFITIGGVSQSIYLRGQDRDKPVLLFVHGGPGVPTMPMARDFGLRLEKDFVVVHWDQRGAGNSCSPEVPDESLNLEQYLADTLEVVNLLRDRFDAEKIFLLGHSWGSVLGLMTAQRHPELLHAYIGMGQVVNMRLNEEISYAFVVERATKEGNEKALRELATIQPPYANRQDLMLQRSWLSHYRGDFLAGGAFAKFIRSVSLSPEYSFGKKMSFYSCAMNSLDQAWDGLDKVDFFESAPRLELPVFFFAGRHDYNTPFELVERYHETLDAPHKEMVWFENSAHSPNLEEPELYQTMLIERVSRAARPNT